MENVNKRSTSIKNWYIDERPREKLIQKGAASLSNAELIAILLRTGNRNNTAIDLAKEILATSQNDLIKLGKISHAVFKKIKGIGETKAITIAAALELGRRRQGASSIFSTKIKCSIDVADYLIEQLKDLDHEVFAVVFLNRANKIIHFEIISRGGITGTVADPRIILKLALQHGATSLIICHNHPSGNLQPSIADNEITKKIKQAAELIDVKLLDHLIVSDEGYYSYLDEGLI